VTAPLSCAVVGAGRIAQTYALAIRALPELRLAAAVDSSPEALAVFAESAGCAARRDLDELLSKDKPDVAVVCTPPATHADIACRLLEAGVHVLCEKPLALNAQEALRMVKAAARGPRLLRMASKFRSVPDIVQAKQLIAAGALGRPVLFENVFCSKVDMSGRWNSRREVSGGGVLIDNGSHSVDVARYLLGRIRRVQAHAGPRLQEIGVEDTLRLNFEAERGVMGTVDLSWSIQKDQDTYVSVYGTEGTLFVGWKSSAYRASARQAWVPFGQGYDKLAAFRGQLADFAAAVAGGAAPEPAEAALDSVRVIEAAYRSLETEKWTAVEYSPL
jgi:predicted dehydrogenase